MFLRKCHNKITDALALHYGQIGKFTHDIATYSGFELPVTYLISEVRN